MGLLTSAFRTEIERVASSAIPAIEISLAGGTTLRYVSATLNRGAVSSLGLGLYEGRVLQWGRLKRSIPDTSNALLPITATIVLDDTDLGFAPYAHRVYMRPATLRLMSAGSGVTSTSDYYVMLTGIVTGRRREGGTRWVLDVRIDDRWLETEFPKGTAIATYEWANAHASAMGKPWPIIYGRHDATSVGGKGQVRAEYVDTAGFRFLLAAHRVKTVHRVYLNGTLKATPADYSVTTPIVSGRQTTLIDFVADPGTDPLVTVDVDGIETVGDGSGSIIDEPVTMLKHLLVNWVYGDYRRGAWLADATAPVDTGWFATALTQTTPYGYRASRWIGDRTRRGIDELNAFCRDWELVPFWSALMEVAVAMLDHTLQGSSIYPSDRIRAPEDVVLGAIEQVFREVEHAARRTVTHLLASRSSEESRAALEIRDTASANVAAEAIDGLWFAAMTGYAGNVRDAHSRALNRVRGAMPPIEVRHPLRFIDHELLTTFGLTWNRGVNDDGTVGFGDETWRRRFLRKLASEIDLDALEEIATYQDVRPMLTTCWQTMHSLLTGAGNAKDGIAATGVGTSLTVSRASSKCLDDPSGRVITIGNNTDPLDARGWLIENAGENTLERSSYVSGMTGLVTFGVSAPGTIAADTTDLLFDTASGNSIKLTADTPHTADAGYTHPQTNTISANSTICVSIDHKDDGGEALAWRLQRDGDLLYWRESDQSWVAGLINNTLPVRAAITRDNSYPIPIGVSARKVTLSILQPSGGTSARVNHAHHAQIDYVSGGTHGWPSSRVVTDTAAVTRAADVVTIANDGDASHVIWTRERGTIEFEWIPLFDAGDVGSSATYYLLYLQYSAGHRWSAWYDKAAGELRFRVTVASTDYTAGIAITPVAGTVYRVALRWTGTEGELGLTAGTADIFIDGVKGTAVVFGTPPTYTNAVSIYVGSSGGSAGTFANAAVRRLRFMPFCKSDAELALTLPL